MNQKYQAYNHMNRVFKGLKYYKKPHRNWNAYYRYKIPFEYHKHDLEDHLYNLYEKKFFISYRCRWKKLEECI